MSSPLTCPLRLRPALSAVFALYIFSCYAQAAEVARVTPRWRQDALLQRSVVSSLPAVRQPFQDVALPDFEYEYTQERPRARSWFQRPSNKARLNEYEMDTFPSPRVTTIPLVNNKFKESDTFGFDDSESSSEFSGELAYEYAEAQQELMKAEQELASKYAAQQTERDDDLIQVLDDGHIDSDVDVARKPKDRAFVDENDAPVSLPDPRTDSNGDRRIHTWLNARAPNAAQDRPVSRLKQKQPKFAYQEAERVAYERAANAYEQRKNSLMRVFYEPVEPIEAITKLNTDRLEASKEELRLQAELESNRSSCGKRLRFSNECQVAHYIR